MSMKLAQLVYKISKDPALADALRAEPRRELDAMGSDLTENETWALLRVLRNGKGQQGALAGVLAWPTWYSEPF
jgi:hypothetical protein